MLKDGEGSSEMVESMVTKQAVTLCGTINIDSSESASCTSKACESYSSDDVLLLSLFN